MSSSSRVLSVVAVPALILMAGSPAMALSAGDCFAVGGTVNHRHGWSLWRFGPVLQNAGYKRGLHCQGCFSPDRGDAPS